MTTDSKTRHAAYFGLVQPQVHRDALLALRHDYPHIAHRWPDPSQYHMTLHFLGRDLTNTDMTIIEKHCDDMSPRSFMLGCDGFDYFTKHDKKHLCYATVTGPDYDRMMLFREELTARLTEAGYPHPMDHFTPHVTIMRWLKPNDERGQEIDELCQRTLVLEPQPYHLALYHRTQHEKLYKPTLI